MKGKIEAIWIKSARKGAMVPTKSATLIAGKGIETDANIGQTLRQVTVVEKEVLDRVMAELPEVEPSMRRANVMVSGVRLKETVGHILTLGEVTLEIQGETRPCERMDAQVPGFTAALTPDWNGGVYGVVLDDGEVNVGEDASIAGPAQS